VLTLYVILEPRFPSALPAGEEEVPETAQIRP